MDSFQAIGSFVRALVSGLGLLAVLLMLRRPGRKHASHVALPRPTTAPSTIRVTHVWINRVDTEIEILKAFATITVNGSLVVRGLKVIEGESGLFVSMPSRRLKNGTFTEIVHAIRREAREEIERAVLTAYRESGEDPASAGVGARLRPPPDDLSGWIARDPRAA